MRRPLIAVCIVCLIPAAGSVRAQTNGASADAAGPRSLVRVDPTPLRGPRPLIADRDLEVWSRTGARLAPPPASLAPSATPGSVSFGDLETSDVPGWIGFAKWTSLGVATGLSALGFVFKETANARFDELEAICERDSDRCRERTRAGAFTDPALERRFQDVLAKDRDARISLIAGQVSFAASLAFFILDFQGGRDPGDIPYDPPDQTDSGDRFELSVRPGELALRYYPD